MFNDNTLELHGLIGNSSGGDIIASKSIFKYEGRNTTTALTTNLMFESNKIVVGKKNIMYIADSNLYYESLLVRNGGRHSLGYISHEYEYIYVFAMSFGFAVFYKTLTDRHTSDFQIKFYDHECNLIKTTDVLTSQSEYNQPVRVIEDSFNGNIYAAAYDYTHMGNVFIFNKNRQLIDTKPTGGGYNLPSWAASNTVIYNNHIYGGSASERWLINYDLEKDEIVAKVYMSYNDYQNYNVAIDPKAGYAFYFRDGITYRLLNMEIVNTSSSCYNDEGYDRHFKCYNPNYITGAPMIWGNDKGLMFDVKFPSTPRDYKGNTYVPDIKLCPEFASLSPTSNVYNVRCSMDGKNAIVFLGSKESDTSKHMTYDIYRR
ncbi:MAG: hypothetical protein E6257_17885 [Clostridium botulinum]|nr:hypothetical protein [Clostridium botulinum]MDU5119935.1 hypothetical protein [Clostridium botulinum]